jgi:hypothetical protein
MNKFKRAKSWEAGKLGSYKAQGISGMPAFQLPGFLASQPF